MVNNGAEPHMMVNSPILLSVALTASFCAPGARACQAPQPSAVAMVREAQVIIRATPEFYVRAATDPLSYDPDSKIQFKVLEVIRGEITENHVVLTGALVDTDDFNDEDSPYKFVRPNGRGGSCFASSYRSNGQFLLMLQKNPDGELTAKWYPLAPVNEQLHSGDDPWLLWVRKEAQKPRDTSAKQSRIATQGANSR